MNHYIQSIEESMKRRKVESSNRIVVSGSMSDSGYVSGSSTGDVSALPGEEDVFNKENIQSIEESTKRKSIEESTKRKSIEESTKRHKVKSSNRIVVSGSGYVSGSSTGDVSALPGEEEAPVSVLPGEEEVLHGEEEVLSGEENKRYVLSLSNSDTHSLHKYVKWERLTCLDTLLSLIEKNDNKLFLFPTMSETKMNQARETKYNIILHVEISKEYRKNPVLTRVAPVYYTQNHFLKDLVMDHVAIVKNDSKELLMTLESVIMYKSFGIRILNIYLVQSNLGERMQHLNNWDLEDKIEDENQIWDLVSKDSSPIFIVKNYRNGKLMLKESLFVSTKQSNAYSVRKPCESLNFPSWNRSSES